MPDRSLDDWLALLESRHPVEIELGLARVAEVANRLALPPLACQVVVVAGTNGKGSCVRTLEQLALAQGLRVAAYTSPHLMRYNERLRLNGRDVEDAPLCNAFDQIEAVRGDVSLTYFEMGTLAAMVVMAANTLDLAVLEVGLGGRFDAVNIVDADVAVITAIDIDHAAWLGNTREAIAVEKAGIARAGRFVVCSDTNPPASLLASLQNIGAKPLFLGQDFHCQATGKTLCLTLAEGAIQTDVEGAARSHAPAWERPNSPDSSNLGSCVELQHSHAGAWEREESLGDPKQIFLALPLPQLPLPSVAAAVQAMALLGYAPDEEVLSEVFARLELPGRYQCVEFRGHRVILDVAHNPAAAGYLAAKLQAEKARVHCVAAIMADKDAEGFVAALAPAVSRWYVGDLPGNSRALSAVALAELLYTRGCSCTPGRTIQNAFDEALAAMGEGDILAVCGSFFTVAAIAKELGAR